MSTTPNEARARHPLPPAWLMWLLAIALGASVTFAWRGNATAMLLFFAFWLAFMVIDGVTRLRRRPALRQDPSAVPTGGAHEWLPPLALISAIGFLLIKEVIPLAPWPLAVAGGVIVTGLFGAAFGTKVGAND